MIEASVREAICAGETRLAAKDDSGAQIPLEARLLPREREWVLAGGKLEYLRDGGDRGGSGGS